MYILSMYMELLSVAYQPDKVIKTDRKESPPPPSHTYKHKTHNTTQHNMGAGPQVPSLENWDSGYMNIIQM